MRQRRTRAPLVYELFRSPPCADHLGGCGIFFFLYPQVWTCACRWEAFNADNRGFANGYALFPFPPPASRYPLEIIAKSSPRISILIVTPLAGSLWHETHLVIITIIIIIIITAMVLLMLQDSVLLAG